ncbi:MAG TPA: glycosyltransferase family 4 protein [Vicinamibacterales bacterium]|nr:glycosyltransferase family 4 protein [Vicinamibacterales bacterium]
MSLRLLLTNVTLAGRTGTEIVTRDLALGLHRRGHRVAVYAPSRGPIADELETAGVRVVTRIDDIDGPDIVHGHHFIETVEALARFPRARGIFVCHDRTAPHSCPPRWPAVQRFVAVDENCLERLQQDCEIPAAETRVILNAVDMSRFAPRAAPLPAKPARALVFSHNAWPGTHADVVRAVCDRLAIPVDVMGAGAGNVADAPEAHLPQYDLVFAKARCALEAMAAGAAVVLCDTVGSGPMVTPDLVSCLRQWNFGARTLTQALNPDRLAREIDKYDPAQAAATSAMIRQEASLDMALDRYEELYREVMELPVPADRSVRPLLQALLRRIGWVEQDLRGFRSDDGMPVLTDGDVAGIRVEIDGSPQPMAAGVPAFIKVRVRNEMAIPLGTWPPFPVQAACRWKPVGAAQFEPAAHAVRSLLHRGIASGDADLLFVRVVPPAMPGLYVLRVTLVQEHRRWLDEAPTPACADVTVTIT